MVFRGRLGTFSHRGGGASFFYLCTSSLSPPSTAQKPRPGGEEPREGSAERQSTYITRVVHILLVREKKKTKNRGWAKIASLRSMTGFARLVFFFLVALKADTRLRAPAVNGAPVEAPKTKSYIHRSAGGGGRRPSFSVSLLIPRGVRRSENGLAEKDMMSWLPAWENGRGERVRLGGGRWG